jgi:pSer/pThr/pTyr-binding forkhead associated (FHA) protein
MSIPQNETAPQGTARTPAVATQAGGTLPVFVFKNGKLDRASTLIANGVGQPRLQVVHGRNQHKEFVLKNGVSTLGRPIENEVDIDMGELEPPNYVWSSRRHALVIVENQKVFIQDCSSRNGTLVNGEKIPTETRVELKTDDLVQIGAVQFRVLC